MTVDGVTVFVCSADGAVVRSEADALDVVAAAAFGVNAELVALPVERLGEEFFDLSTGLAGAVTQKILTYRLRLAVVGDISAHLAESSALRAYVYESNNGRQLWFVPTMAELEERLST